MYNNLSLIIIILNKVKGEYNKNLKRRDRLKAEEILHLKNIHFNSTNAATYTLTHISTYRRLSDVIIWLMSLFHSKNREKMGIDEE
jgi:hypothetical protein